MFKNTATRKGNKGSKANNSKKANQEESKTQNQQMLQDQADTIYRIIKGLPEPEEGSGNKSVNSKGAHAQKWNA